MRKIIEKIKSPLKSVAFLLTAFLAVAAIAGCSNGSDKEEDFGEKGYVIVGSLTDADGAAVVSCGGSAQNVTLSFRTRSSYTVSTNGDAWIKILSGETGEGGDCSVKLKVLDNMSGDQRITTVYIETGGKRSKLATVTQSKLALDPLVQVMDKTLEEQYYWLDGYKRMKETGKIDYTKKEQDFLDGALLNMGTINLSDGYYDNKGKRHLFSYVRETSAMRASEDVSQVSGFGIDLCYTIITYSDSPYYGFLVEHVYPGSPADIVGISRGDEIKTVNGKNIDGSNYENLFYSVLGGGSISIGCDEGGSIVEYNLSAANYYQSPVACAMMLKEEPSAGFDFKGKKIGYISYLSFEHDFDDELAAAIESLASQGATDLVVDLRNNGGGHVISSVYFASMLLPKGYAGKPMVILERHPRNPNGNDVMPFADVMDFDGEKITLPHLNLENVYFITSDGTASASELLIMGMRAQGVEAKTVGKTSMGKDCGMDVYRISVSGKTYEFAPITFMNKFENYNVDFNDGIVPDIDFDALMDKVKNENLKGALDWYPLPAAGAAWGDYLSDIALGEAVANILGGTIFEVSSPQGKAFAAPATRAAGSQKMGKFKTIESERVAGMYLWEHEREQLRNLNK